MGNVPRFRSGVEENLLPSLSESSPRNTSPRENMAVSIGTKDASALYAYPRRPRKQDGRLSGVRNTVNNL